MAKKVKGDNFYPFVPTDEELAELDKNAIAMKEAAVRAKWFAAEAKKVLKSITNSGVKIFTFYLDEKPYKTRKRMMPAYLIRMKAHNHEYWLVDDNSNRLNDFERYDCDGGKFYSIPPCHY